MRLSHITHLLYTPCRALSIGFAKFGAIFNYFCAIFYEKGTAKDGQLCVILIFYGGRKQNVYPNRTENRAAECLHKRKAEPYKRLRRSFTVFLSAQAPEVAVNLPE